MCGQIGWSRHYSAKKIKEKPIKSKIKTKPVEVWRGMTVADIAKAVNRNVDDVFETMFYVDNCDHYDKESSVIQDERTIHQILKLMGKRSKFIGTPAKISSEKVNKDAIKRPAPDPSQLVKRPPVVTIMGHVDHGKTTLLDTLRHTSVVSQEFGGITQHIGAFLVKVRNQEAICFLDTPGHAAFSAMRERGANATDIVVLVVAADDGVMEQTVESIKYAKAANVPIIVAINKMDKANANPTRVKDELVKHGVQVEDKGGDVQAIHISARNGDNLDSLVEAIQALTEVLEIKGDPKGLVEGVIIESSIDPGRGKLATVLVQRGTLQRGDILVVGYTWAKVRTMFDENGRAVSSAPPSTPVQVIGWREKLPSAGDIVLQVENEARANEVMRWRNDNLQEQKALESLPAIQKKLDEHLSVYKERLRERIATGNRTYWYRKETRKAQTDTETDNTPVLYILIKGDVDGSVEAILDLLETYDDQKKCQLDVVHYGVGNVIPADVDLADTFKALIYTFNVGMLSEASAMLKQKNTTIKHFNVIYKLFDDLKEEINSRIPSILKEEVIGEATLLQEFKVSERNKKVPVAGCRCIKGNLKKSEKFKVLRNEEVLYEGEIESMYHLKNEVDSVKKDVECGLRFPDRELRFEPGDVIQCYRMVPVTQVTEWDPGF